MPYRPTWSKRSADGCSLRHSHAIYFLFPLGFFAFGFLALTALTAFGLPPAAGWDANGFHELGAGSGFFANGFHEELAGAAAGALANGFHEELGGGGGGCDSNQDPPDDFTVLVSFLLLIFI